jgi:chitodextrinase
VKHLPKLLVVLFVLAFTGRAEAQILTFNEMAPTDNPILGTVVCGPTVGFLFSSDHFHVTGGDFLEPFTSNGTSHIGYEAGRGFPIRMERLGGGTFRLISLDAGEFHYPPAPDRPDAETLTITGFQQGGGLVTYTVNIDGLRDGPGGIPDYQHFVLPSTFVNLTSVMFTGLISGNSSGGIALDNLEYDAGAPEVLPACVATPIVPPVPTINITNPLPAYVAGTVLVEAAPGVNVTLASVQFSVDGVALGAPVTAAPYQVSWNTRLVADGPHTIVAEGRDLSNNLATASVTVTVRNAPVSGATPHYLELDGVDDYVQAADSPALSFGNGTVDTPLTIETWFRPDAMGRHQLLGKWGETAKEYQLQIVSGSLRFDLRDNSTQGEAFVLTFGNFNGLIGTWHHLAVTYDGRGGSTAANGIMMYVDGVAVSLYRETSATYVAMENLSAPLVIGREGPGWKQYDGGLDEVRLWNFARTASELQFTMATELAGSEPGLVGYWRFNEGSGETAADEGPGDQLATLINGPVWAPEGPLAPDVAAPDITGIVTSNVTAASVTVSFQTSEVTTAHVLYTATTTCPCTDVVSAVTGTSHVVTMSGLAADTLYQFVVSAADAAGNVRTSAPLTVRTLLANADGVPPTVALTSLAAGYVAGTVLVQATATDNVGVASVQFRVDGVALGAPVTAAPYQVSWNTTLVADGVHTITAQGRDLSNNTATATMTVTVRNTPVSTAPHYLELDGVDDYLEVGDAPGLSFGNGTADTPLTIETWFRPDAMGRHQLLGKWGETTNQEYQLQIVSGFLRFDLRDNSTQGSATVFTVSSFNGLIGSWHHLAVTYDGRGGSTAANGITVYVDGVAVSLNRETSATYVAMENLAAPLVIGREGPSWKQYDGGLDEIRLWNIARTAAELQASMNLALTGAEPGLVGYWQLNDGVGISAAGGTPGSPSADLVNGPVWAPGGR